MSIAIIDYGAGNLRSVQKALEKLGFQTIITNEHSAIRKTKGIILSGVGAFDSAVEELESKNLIDTIKDEIKSGKPFLGLCLGMQLLFERSSEGNKSGLGIIKGSVEKFDFSSGGSSKIRLKIPHMGWNNIKFKKDSLVLQNILNNSKVYFVHSYYCNPQNEEDVLTTTEYGGEFTSAINRDNIFAFQFHPEKSGNTGLQILKNFGSMCI